MLRMANKTGHTTLRKYDMITHHRDKHRGTANTHNTYGKKQQETNNKQREVYWFWRADWESPVYVWGPRKGAWPLDEPAPPNSRE